MRNQKGITLIALVITIIVLLILAGVAIAMLSGDNGILSNASNAAKESAISTAKEEIGVKVNEVITQAYADMYVNSTDTSLGLQGKIVAALGGFTFDDITYTAPAVKFEKKNAQGTVEKELYVLKIVYKGDNTFYEASIDEYGTITWGAENTAITAPEGFTAKASS